jgi:hypothetical protein
VVRHPEKVRRFLDGHYFVLHCSFCTTRGAADCGFQCWLVVAAASPVLPWKLHIRMANSEMPRKSIGAAERLLFRTEFAAHLLLASIVDCVLVPREVVWSRENCVARLACAWIDSVAPVRTCLCHSTCSSQASICAAGAGESLRLSMTLSLVLL